MLRGGQPERTFARYLEATLRNARRILDVGTSEPFAKELRGYRQLFDGKVYFAVGYQPRKEGEHCHCYQDVECLAIASDSVDAVLCIEVLEHVREPFVAVGELWRVLKPAGKLFLTVPFLTGYHGKGGKSQGHDDYPDLWRFTHEGLGHLLRRFVSCEVVPLDGPIEVRLKQVVGETVLASSPIRRALDAIDPVSPGRATTRHLALATK